MKMDNETKMSSNWIQANLEGRKMAADLVGRIVSDQNPTLLGWALKEMISRKDFGGVEVGFANEIAECLIKGNANVRQYPAS
ncbi:MAG: hypothetical protein ACOH2T_27970 [Pseudomonas sp.]